MKRSIDILKRMNNTPVSLEWPEEALSLQSILKLGLENLGETHGSASPQGLDGKMPLPG